MYPCVYSHLALLLPTTGHQRPDSDNEIEDVTAEMTKVVSEQVHSIPHRIALGFIRVYLEFIFCSQRCLYALHVALCFRISSSVTGIGSD